MISIPYEIVHNEYTGDTLGGWANMMKEDEEECWEARTEKAVFMFVFGETKIHEIRIGVLSSVKIRLEAANESDLSDHITFIEKSEYITTSSLKTASYQNSEVHFTQHLDRLFSRLEVQITNLEPKKNTKIAYIRLYKAAERPSESLKRKSEEPQFISKRPKIDPQPAQNFSSISMSDPVVSSANPPEKSYISPITPKPVIQVTHRLPSVCYDKAETSYNQLLTECVVTCLDDSEHVRRLCDCLGAVFLDHLDEITTHVVIGEGLRELCRDIGERTRAKLVSVGWLESCLEERERKQEEEYRLI